VGEREDVPFEGHDPYRAECEHFVRSVEGKADPEVIGGASAREALRVALAAKEAVRHGRIERVRKE
jgi:predicted dehydrogenase